MKNLDAELDEMDESKPTKRMSNGQRKVIFLMFWIILTVIQSAIIYNVRWSLTHPNEVKKLQIAYEELQSKANKELEGRLITSANASVMQEPVEAFPLSQQ